MRKFGGLLEVFSSLDELLILYDNFVKGIDNLTKFSALGNERLGIIFDSVKRRRCSLEVVCHFFVLASERGNHFLIFLLPLIKTFNGLVELIEVFLNELIDKRVHLLLELLGNFLHNFNQRLGIALFEQFSKFIKFTFKKFVGLIHATLDLIYFRIEDVFKFLNLVVDAVLGATHTRKNIEDFGNMVGKFRNFVRRFLNRFDGLGLFRSGFFEVSDRRNHSSRCFFDTFDGCTLRALNNRERVKSGRSIVYAGLDTLQSTYCKSL